MPDPSRADVLLVGYERQENLGLRSIVSYLNQHGCHAVLVPFCPGNDAAVLSAVQQYHPRLVGFSLIFQYTLDEFGKLMRFLRAGGVTVHFTAGGHYPSLRPVETLGLIPELDTIVRFEGEATLLELVEQLENHGAWEAIPGLAFRDVSGVRLTEPRPLIPDLDRMPLLYRDEPQEMGGVKIAAMLASRGCLFDCSFCSIRQFYGASQGVLRRVRSPQAVVRDMKGLYTQKNIRFFSFQDDDFAARSPAQKKWLDAFLAELKQSGLAGNVAWKISCRVDDLDSNTLDRMLDHGLIAVYLGVESGNDIGLEMLNKHVSVAQNMAAVDLLKQHQVALAIGFMLFDPSSTIDTIRQNIDFLRTVGADGYFPLNFCKMLPYAGTPIERMLRNEGRLKGTVTQPDYGFIDPTVDWYEFLVQKAFNRRNFSPDGIVALLQRAEFNCRLAQYFTPTRTVQDFSKSLGQIIRHTNLLAIRTLETLLQDLVTCGVDFLLKDQDRLISVYEAEWEGEMRAEVELKKLCVSDGAGSELLRMIC